MAEESDYILANCGLFYIWLNQNRIDKKCKSIIHKRIEDIAHQKWYIYLSNSSLCTTYNVLRHSYTLKTLFETRIAKIESI